MGMMGLRVFCRPGPGRACFPSEEQSPRSCENNPIAAFPALGAGGTGFGKGSPRFPKQPSIFIRRAAGLAASSPSPANLRSLLPEPESEAGREGPWLTPATVPADGEGGQVRSERPGCHGGATDQSRGHTLPSSVRPQWPRPRSWPGGRRLC